MENPQPKDIYYYFNIGEKEPACGVNTGGDPNHRSISPKRIPSNSYPHDYLCYHNSKRSCLFRKVVKGMNYCLYGCNLDD